MRWMEAVRVMRMYAYFNFGIWGDYFSLKDTKDTKKKLNFVLQILRVVFVFHGYNNFNVQI